MLKINKIDVETAINMVMKDWTNSISHTRRVQAIDTHDTRKGEKSHIYLNQSIYFKDAFSMSNAEFEFKAFFSHDLGKVKLETHSVRFFSEYSNEVRNVYRMDVTFFYGWK